MVVVLIPSVAHLTWFEDLSDVRKHVGKTYYQTRNHWSLIIVVGDQYDGIKLADMALVTVSYGQMSYQSITEERAVDLVDVVGKVLSAEMVTFIIFANDSHPFSLNQSL